MAELLEKISELRDLPPDQHLFCPRIGEDGSVYFEEDLANLGADTSAVALREREEKIAETKKRTLLTLDALQILAFDSDDAAPHQEWLSERVGALMTSCDVCVRVFHQSRAEWKNRLYEEYDDENVAAFLAKIDDVCITRISNGLDTAQSILQAAEPKARGVRILPNEATYAFFEALSCDALIRNEELLQTHFDNPFQLVQSKKRLKLQTFLPAMTRFLFCSHEGRQNWAAVSWKTFKRNILKSEFEWAARDHLVDAMAKVQMWNLDLPFVATFWSGARLIVEKLDINVITFELRSLDGQFYRLLLDHLSLPSEGFFDILGAMAQLLQKSPTSFWEAMDGICPSTATVVEQVFNSPILKQVLLAATENDEQANNLEDAFAWITPFLESIKPTNLTPVCRAFANQLLGRLQSEQYSVYSRARCFKEGLRVLDFAFRKMSEGKISKTTTSKFVGQPTVNGMLEVLSKHIQPIVVSMKRFDGLENTEDLRLTLSMIQHAFVLEAQALMVERQLISAKTPSPTEPLHSRSIWTTIIAAIDPGHIDLATHLLVAGRNLIGLEPLFMKKGAEPPKEVRRFNDTFDLLSQSITDIIDRLSEFDPGQLDVLFEQPAAASGIISCLFSSTPDTRNSTVELLKVISSQDERRGALQHILRGYYKNVLYGISESCRQIRSRKAFAPAPAMINTLSDIVDIMCNSTDGILRSRDLDSAEAAITMALWKSLWDALSMIFGTTEAWSILGYDKNMMMDFCRDTMQFADQLFDQCSIFVMALKAAKTAVTEAPNKANHQKALLELPAKTMDPISKWLRLRDEFLSTKSVSLISKLLVRLKGVSIEVDEDTSSYIEKVLSGEVRAKLSMQQQASLQQSLEKHLGHSIRKLEETVKQQKQGSISQFLSTTSDRKPSEEDVRKKLLADTTQAATKFQAQREAIRARESKKVEALNQQKSAKEAEFKQKRALEIERKKKEREAAIAKLKQNRGTSIHTSEAGSGLDGLGVLGKDQAAKGEGLMHSSDESEDDGDFDEELFGVKAEKKPKSGPKTNIVNEIKVPMPVRKKRVVRSVKDMRARLAPDLSPLHKVILGWDYFHKGDTPPSSRDDMYSAVPNTFRTPNEYQSTFEPLLTLEAWQSFAKSREDVSFKPYEIKVISRASVDSFQEVGSTMTHNENRDLHISEGDIVLLSKSKTPSAQDPHCLARVIKTSRKKAHIEVSYRVMPSNPLQSSLVPNGTVFGSKIQSLTPLEREYAALLGLQYYDLCDEIIRAYPSPILTYKDEKLQPLINNYSVNKAQAKAIRSAIENDAFTLVQGPPGSGKTKTIVAIVGAILSDSFKHRGTAVQIPGQARSDTAAKKLLVCAPSNAAVDELVMRFKGGVKTMNGEERKLNIVRLGRSDAINANVQDVTLEELVNKKLGVNPTGGPDSEATKKLFQEHKEISEQVRQVRALIDGKEVQDKDASKLQDDFNQLRRRKAMLGTQIDKAKDDEKHAVRNADINRRRAQEQVLNDAHVICATLSGSGHDMFQNLSIEFETVIIDEAAQCVEMSALIPLKYGCAKCILVGDPKQLPPTVLSKEAAKYQYEQSLFVRMQNNHPKDVHLLDTQYRMHPAISKFPSQAFYDGRLLDGTNMDGLRQRSWHSSTLLAPYRFFDVQGQHQSAGTSLINIAEIRVAMQLYDRLTTDFRDPDNNGWKGKLGVITPYKSQLRELKSRFSAKYGNNIVDEIDFNTTDAFQGRESEIIIFSCVRASGKGGIGFLQDVRRMNVGLTRAKSSLWVLGNTDSLERGAFWKKMIVDAKERGAYLKDYQNLLSKPASSHPRPRDTVQYAAVRSLPTQLKQELEEYRLTSNGKRKLSRSSEEDVKMEDDDVEMEDAPEASEAASHSGTDSRRSTPAANGARNSTTPAPEAKAEQPAQPRPGDVMGAMMKPKIKKRPKQPPSMFIQRPPAKKPKNG
ncbi:SEN1 N terminal-domain-containing protein [Lophiotrema nucula]|uniref:SEN1 N terminal-domain-containing protein n=1 Tax=Lophiotrema nucula TaxID=690887 RepID=A0A6A5ZB15_9PLEO|nr:SEN1 N terminal-domain-containing protein [Lophiotrema nucula]